MQMAKTFRLLTAAITLGAGCTVGTSVVLLGLVPQAATAQVRVLPDFTDLVDQVGPSVVNIRTLEKVATRGPGGAEMDEDMLEFFRRFGLPVPNSPKQAPKKNTPPSASPREEQPKGVASGFILTSDGLIMTNAHVVDGADELWVTLTDKREFKAKIVGVDKRTDVAVVKIEASGLPAVKVGDVSRLKVGEWVMAIGSPFGLENTVTAGIVSAKQRDTGDFLPFIQTDVAINPGNSGGPLINMRGEVVGMNSQIYSRSGGFMGISFAIPIDEAVRVSDQLRTSGKVSRGRIGVQIEPVAKDVADSLGLAKAVGAMVVNVESGSPAGKAGIEAGDIITRFDGKAVDKSIDLPRIVGAVKPGTKAAVTVMRRGTSKELMVQVGEFDADKVADKADVAPDDKPATGLAGKLLGLGLGELSDSDRKALDIRSGVRIVQADDAAARAGLREGDVILSVANVEVASIKAIEAVLAKVDRSKPVVVLYRRGDFSRYAVLKIAK